MKRLLVMIALLAMFASCAQMGMKDPKTMACEKACSTAQDECLKEADTDKIKEVACNVAKDKCVEKCN